MESRAVMKILFINIPKSDYLQEFLYSGLCKVVGTQNITEYPSYAIAQIIITDYKGMGRQMPIIWDDHFD